MLVLIFGTRPESIKLGPVARALREAEQPFSMICTSQHWDLLRGTPAETDLYEAQSLNLRANGNPLNWVAGAQKPLQRALEELEASYVVVQGDTASALAGAKAAAGLSIPIAHIEAGVRSFNADEPWPEEGFRREITQLASFHFSPTTQAHANLLAEGVPSTAIRLTGNPVVSALACYGDVPLMYPTVPAYIVVTMHRREWLMRDDTRRFCQELALAAEEHPLLNIIWPVHPAVKPRLPKSFAWPKSVWLDSPLPYGQMVQTLRAATGVATDSGGLVEEAATLGVPCAIMRRANDRPEAVAEGVARQFAPTDIRAAVACLAQGGLPRRPTAIYGEAWAAEEIARQLVRITA